MKRLACLVPILAACTSSPAGAPPAASVRDLLTTDGAMLAVSPTASDGAITARLWSTQWEDSAVELAITGGELAVSANDGGRVALDAVAVDLAPIALSAEVFDEPTRLVDLHAELAADPPLADTTWTNADAGTARTTIALELSWSLEVSDRITPLGPVTLSGLPVELELTGTGDHVDARLALQSDGTLWSWAGLIELADLSLSLTAATADEDE